MDFQTPNWVCEYMVGLIPDRYDITKVLEPTPGEGNLVRALICEGFNVTSPNDFWEVFGKRFDAVVMNPPFSPMSEGYKILYAVMGMTDIIIALMPWLTIINGKKRAKSIYEYGLKSVTHLPRDVFPKSRVQTCILEMQRGYAGKREFYFLENKSDKYYLY